MQVKTYKPAIIAKYEKRIQHLQALHDADQDRIKKVVNIDVNQADELDKLENGFCYGGSKNGNRK